MTVTWILIAGFAGGAFWLASFIAERRMRRRAVEHAEHRQMAATTARRIERAAYIAVPIACAFAYLALADLGLTPFRLALNAAAMLICGVSLVQCAASWSSVLHPRACARLFGCASVVMSLGSIGVALFYRWVWKETNQGDLVAASIRISGVLLLAPCWVAMQLGVSALGRLYGSIGACAIRPPQ